MTPRPTLETNQRRCIKVTARLTARATPPPSTVCVNLCAVPCTSARLGQGTLGGNEALASVCLLPGTGNPLEQGPTAPWTPENTFLTASNKLNRKPIEAGFATELKAVKAKGIR